ncbi:MAG TPA: outer membrane beta-barrel protein [Terriglobia bacterium]|nr:outer membrane beta-barrel protein [Terriglobia bacterium]
MFKVALTLTLALAFGQDVFGQSYFVRGEQDWEVSGFAGASVFSGDFHFSTPVLDDSPGSVQQVEMEYASGYQIGIRIGEYVGDHWAADLEYSFANQPIRFKNLAPLIPTLSLSQSIHHVSYSFSYLFADREARFRPYAKFGAGVAIFDVRRHSRDFIIQGLDPLVRFHDSTKFMVNLGGGAEFYVGDQVALIFDVKDNLTGIPSYGLPRFGRIINGIYRPGIDRDGVMNNWQFNAGIAFIWD